MVNARSARSGFVLIGVVFLTFVVSITLVALVRSRISALCIYL